MGPKNKPTPRYLALNGFPGLAFFDNLEREAVFKVVKRSEL